MKIKGNDKLCVTFITDGVESAISQAKKAADILRTGMKKIKVVNRNTYVRKL